MSETTAPRGTATRGAMAGVILGLIAMSLDTGSVATALPTMVDELGGLEQLPWVVAAYLLASTVVLPIYGGWSDALGRKPLFIWGLSIIAAGSLMAATAPNVGWLVAARVITGIGAGGIVILAQSMVADVVPASSRSRHLGVLGALLAVGNTIGPVIGGLITETLGWRWVFAALVPISLVAVAVAARFLPATTAMRRERSLDTLGGGLIAVSLSALVLAIVLGGGRLSWSHPAVIALMIVAGLVGVVLFSWERRLERGVLPVRLMKGRDLTLALLVAFITGTAIMGLVFFTPVFLQVAAGASPSESGVLMLPLMGAFMATSIISGRVIARIGRYKAFPVAGTIVLAVGFGLLGTMSVETPLGLVAVFLAIAGIGVGLVMHVIILAVQNMVPSDAIGSATSVTQLSRAMGGTVGVTAFGSVLTARFASRLDDLGVTGVRGRNLLDDPDAADLLGEGAREAVSIAAADAVTFVFALAVPICIAALFAALSMRERPLSSEIRPAVVADG
jgi:EmrB/QacA subfamily drug resistance transporter